MKKNIPFLGASIFLIAAIFAFKLNGFVLPIGSNLPKAEVRMKDIRDEVVSMKEAKKTNGLLVMFSCNTCPYVMKNQERTRAICNYALQKNIGVILLNSNAGDRRGADSYEAMQQYATAQKYNWYYVVDKNNEIADAFGANRTPENFLFDKSLKLVYHGAIDDNPTDGSNVKRQHLREAINEMLEGKEITVKESRSMGCAIKRM